MLKDFNLILTRYLVLSKKKVYLFLFLSFVLSLFQIFGVISIYPLVTILVSPNIILENKFFQEYYPLSYVNNYTLLIQFSFIFLFINIISFLTIILNNILTETLSTGIRNKIKINFYKKVLNFSSFHQININKSEFINQSHTEIENINTCISAIL